MGTESTITELENHARSVRRLIVRMIHESGTAGHYGGSLSCVEILSCLYFGWMRHRPEDPGWEERDRLVLSKGHASPALYAVLAEAGYFPMEQLGSFKRFGGILQGHPDMKLTPGVDMSTGSLGQGLSVALGMALAGKLDGKAYRVYALLGDGELDEGSVWEAAMAASHYRADNLTAIVDRNNLQISGPTEWFMRLEPLKRKWEAFGWEVMEVDGHRIEQILQALVTMDRVSGRPGLIIAETVKGKGIRFLENKKEGHSCALREEQFAAVMQELESG
jgi:transketolase